LTKLDNVSIVGNKGDKTMKLQILGTGCPKCLPLEANTRLAISMEGIEAKIEKVTDIEETVGRGVMMTPDLVIDSEVVSLAKVLDKDQILGLIKGAN
jgi:small redox-active disulfide protein 2